MMIDYQKISKAIQYYKNLGYQELEVPWIVSEDIIRITLPPNGTFVSTSLGILVASAEQSFLDKKRTSNVVGKFQATTPCFRDEIEDELHQKYFMKTELFINDVVSKDNLEKVISDCSNFFSQFLTVKVIKTGDLQYDIVDVVNDIEIGSYGIREDKVIGKWIYATACAEPRLSTAMRKSYRV